MASTIPSILARPVARRATRWGKAAVASARAEHPAHHARLIYSAQRAAPKMPSRAPWKSGALAPRDSTNKAGFSPRRTFPHSRVTSDLALHNRNPPSSRRHRSCVQGHFVPVWEPVRSGQTISSLRSRFCPQLIEPHRFFRDFPLTVFIYSPHVADSCNTGNCRDRANVI